MSANKLNFSSVLLPSQLHNVLFAQPIQHIFSSPIFVQTVNIIPVHANER